MFPNITTIDQYRAFDLRGPEVQDATREVFAQLQIPVTTIEFPADGSSPLAIVDNKRVLKFFAPVFDDGFDVEVRSLKFTSQIKNVSPELIHAGSIDGWNYVVMTKLEGQSLKNLWPDLAKEEIASTCHAVGENLRKIHELSISQNDFMPFNWSQFIEGQKIGCVQRHEKLGLDAKLVKQIPSFLDSVDLISTGPNCFLHTEVMRDHVFFDRLGKKISFSGFIDFEPSMVGAAEYDFASVGIFLSSGDPHALRSFFEGYGTLKAVDNNFRRRIMAYALLHRYSNLKWYLDFMPSARSLDELAEIWWAT